MAYTIFRIHLDGNKKA
ncbi:hypothetical protein ACLB1S_17750 [Escherichia coli]